MKKLLCFFLVILVLVSPALAADGSTLVYTTRTGECYHRYSCSSLSKSCYETTLSQAVADGYRPCGRCHPPTLDSGSSSAKPSLSDRIAANNSSGSSSGSSYSGYSSGSSSYSSRASVSSSRSANIGETIKTLALFLFVYPPMCLFTWKFIILLIKSIFRKVSDDDPSDAPPAKSKKAIKVKRDKENDRFTLFFLIGFVPLAMWFLGLLTITEEVAYWLIDDVLPRSFFDGPLNTKYLVGLVVEIVWCVPALCRFEILSGKHFIRLPVARVYRILYFAYSIAGASLFVTKGDVTPLHWVLFAVLCAASLAWSIWHWIESESFPVEKDD